MRTETAHANDGTEAIRFTRWGIGANYVGAHATFTLKGRKYLVDVVGQRHREGPAACWLFKVRHFNGEDVEALQNSEIAAAAVRVLVRS